MAYPVIEDIVSGSDAGSTVSITMPDNLAEDELILVFLGIYEASYTGMTSSSSNFNWVASFSDPGANRQLIIIYARAYAGTINNYLNVTISSGTYGGTFVVYRISGHGIYSSSDIDISGAGYYADPYTSYTVLPLTVYNPAGSLYLASVIYSTVITNMGEPPFWDFGATAAYFQSITTSSIEWSLVSNLPESYWTGDQLSYSSSYTTSTLRIKPGVLGYVGPASTGITLAIPTGHIGLA